MAQKSNIIFWGYLLILVVGLHSNHLYAANFFSKKVKKNVTFSESAKKEDNVGSDLNSGAHYGHAINAGERNPEASFVDPKRSKKDLEAAHTKAKAEEREGQLSDLQDKIQRLRLETAKIEQEYGTTSSQLKKHTSEIENLLVKYSKLNKNSKNAVEK